MARHYFHLHESETVVEDFEGQECSSLKDAIQIATRAARDVMIGEIRAGRLSLDWFISISAAGSEVARVRFRDAVSLAPRSLRSGPH